MNWTHSIVTIALLSLLLGLVAACGPGPKSQALEDLERQLQDPSAKEVKEAPGANKPYREARQYRRLSLEARDEGKEELSKEYAILGLLRYRTAVAIDEQHAAKKRFDEADANVSSANPEIKALNQEQLKLSDEVAELERKVAMARRKKEEAERRKKALASQQAAQQDARQDQAKLTAIKNKLEEVETAKRKADDVDASRHAPQKYNPAVNAVKSIRTLLNSDQANDEMLADANRALRLFEEAQEAAKPKYEEVQEKQNPALRKQKIRAAAEAAFGGPYTFSEPAGVRVVLAGAFATDSSTVRGSSQRLLAELTKLAKKYDEFSIYVEGYTRKGDATENLSLSQLRARTVADHLKSNGIKASRIETKGQGQDRRRYPGEPAKNDRVEVVFTR